MLSQLGPAEPRRETTGRGPGANKDRTQLPRTARAFTARSAGHEAEWVAHGISVHTPSHRFAVRTWTRGNVLAGHGSARGYYPPMSSIKIADQDVEMRAGRRPIAISGSLERKPLAMRRRFQRDPAWIPLHRRPAEQPGPEGCQAPRISSVQHDLAYPPDHVTVAHELIITDFAGLL
jgi:hypothetical protein